MVRQGLWVPQGRAREVTAGVGKERQRSACPVAGGGAWPSTPEGIGQPPRALGRSVTQSD